MDALLAQHQDAAAEFVGTFVFLSSILAAAKSGANVTLKLSLALACCAQLVGASSGGHMNPAVTATLWVKGDFVDTQKIVEYIGAQIAGAATAWIFHNFLMGGSSVAAPPEGNVFVCALAEAVGTCVFFTGILASGGDAYRVGLSLYVAANMVGAVSGGHLNPAVTVMMLLKGDVSVTSAALYVPAQLVGGVAALHLAGFLA